MNRFSYWFSATLVSLGLASSVPADGEALTMRQFDRQSERPLYFTENKGQWDDRVLFKANGANGLTWFIERDGFTVLISMPDSNARPLPDPRCDGLPKEMRGANEVDRYSGKSHSLKFKFQNTLPSTVRNWLRDQTTPAAASRIEATARLSWYNNYFLGNDPSKWAPNCGNFGRVIQHDVWKGIDVEWYESNGHVEFDFVVNPGADPSQVGMRIEGLTSEMEVTGGGEELLLPTSLGTLRFTLPEAYQAGDGNKANPVPAHFAVTGANQLSLTLPEGYDAGKKLIVDPLVYSTYLGGGSDDYALAITPDGAGGAFVGGQTSSNDFPTTEGAIDRGFNGGYDAYVAHLSFDGGGLLYSTFLGGWWDDGVYAIVLDGVGGVIVAGVSNNNGFPTTEGAFDRSFNGGAYDAFVARLNGDGSELVYSTYIGGAGEDWPNTIIQDGAGGVILAGYTASDDFPTSDGVFDRSLNGGYDAFVVRLSGDGRELIYGTYLGGSADDFALALSPDGEGGMVVTGSTASTNFPTTEGAFDRSFNGAFDTFVTKLNANGSALIYSTFLGGNGDDGAYAIASDGADGVVVAGVNRRGDFPTTDGAYQRNYNGDEEAFLARLSPDGSDLIYGTYLGGSGNDYVRSLVSDGAGGVVAAGYTESNNLPTTEDAFDNSFNGNADAFIAMISEDGSRLLYSTYIGGGNEERAWTLALDGAGGVVVAGNTSSDDFPVTERAFDRSFNGGVDAFVTDLNIGLPFFLRWIEIPSVAESVEDAELIIDVQGESCNPPAALTLRYHSDDIPNANTWFNDNGDGSGSFGWDLGYDDAGRYTATFTLSDSMNEISADVAVIIHNVNLPPNHFRLNRPPDHSPVPADSLIAFVWNRSTDDDRDTLTYLLRIIGGQNAITYTTGDTTRSVARSNLLALLTSDSLRWEVWANDGTDSTRCASVFTLLRPLDASGFILHSSSFILRVPYPNPFNSTTQISFDLPQASPLSVRIYDLSGRQVTTLVDGYMKAGQHTTVWNASAVAPGIYLVRMETAGEILSQKLQLVK